MVSPLINNARTISNYEPSANGVSETETILDSDPAVFARTAGHSPRRMRLKTGLDHSVFGRQRHILVLVRLLGPNRPNASDSVRTDGGKQAAKAYEAKYTRRANVINTGDGEHGSEVKSGRFPRAYYFLGRISSRFYRR